MAMLTAAHFMVFPLLTGYSTSSFTLVFCVYVLMTAGITISNNYGHGIRWRLTRRLIQGWFSMRCWNWWRRTCRRLVDYCRVNCREWNQLQWAAACRIGGYQCISKSG
ncbi:hypothetical protein EDD18DRAFT_1185684 [Armillaria luteobubalina]|uniref:Uncharacterized protein n=1 Tax=Armillaria luteobubalina TaxID=153913 RepID=A0AA39UKS3_9AGAR|nr:hypothetical protein EDD18DRAFT_1185684 [Armillaria luteobubalina]